MCPDVGAISGGDRDIRGDGELQGELLCSVSSHICWERKALAGLLGLAVHRTVSHCADAGHPAHTLAKGDATKRIPSSWPFATEGAFVHEAEDKRSSRIDPTEPARVVLWPAFPTLPRSSHPPTQACFAQVVAPPHDLLAVLAQAGDIKCCVCYCFFPPPSTPSTHYDSLDRLVQHPFHDHQFPLDQHTSFRHLDPFFCSPSPAEELTMSSDSKEKVDQVLYETTDHNYAAERTDSIVSHPHDGSIQFDAKGLPSDPEQYATWRRGIRKLDWRAVPPLGLLWLANFVDRSNVGNAKVAGLTTDLKLDGNKFNIALAIFYITYIASEIPSNMALRKFGAKFWLPFIVFCWGIITVFFGLVQNFAGLCVIRLLLGLWEGGLLPGMPLYLSQLYPRYMVQVRIAYFYAGASLSGAFGGLLASGLIQMDGLGVQNRLFASLRPVTAKGVAGWRWIFIMEGLITIVFACIAWYMLPASVKKSKFLKDDERELMLAVLGRDQQNNRAAAASVAPLIKTNGDTEKHLPPVTAPNAVVAVGDTAVQQAMVFEEEQFEWREIRRGLTEPQAWFTGIAYLLICNCLYSFSLFLPTILRGIYPTITTTRLQLLTVPPYVPATVLVIIIAYLADKSRMRGPFILALLPLSMIGYIMLLATDNAKVSYGATFLIALGIYPTAPCILSIPINNTSGLYKRGTVNALQLMIANLAGFVATFIYQAKWAPRYVQGHSVVLASLVGAWIFMAINVWWCWSENRARDQGRREGNWAAYQKLVDEGKTRAPIGDRSPQFRYTL